MPASTTYYYQVASVNGDGTSDYSNTASATTQAAGVGTSLTVASITLSTVNAGRGFKSGLAVVTIVDDIGNPIETAMVSGEFSGDITESSPEAQTGADGSVTIPTSGTAKPLNTLTFCVTSVTHDDPALQDLTPPAPGVCASL